jgi:hypothetical protein
LTTAYRIPAANGSLPAEKPGVVSQSAFESLVANLSSDEMMETDTAGRARGGRDPFLRYRLAPFAGQPFRLLPLKPFTRIASDEW